MAKKKKANPSAYVWGVTRISLGLIFLWAFLDKLFGLGFTTCRDTTTNMVEVMCDKAWAQGGSPTTGFLKFGTQGPFSDFYQSLAGNGLVDMLFMAGLLGIGTALILGIGMRLATVSGVLMLVMMYAAVLPPEHHPFIDDHVIYSLVLVGLLLVNKDQKLGLRSWWVNTKLVKNVPVLE